MFYPARMKRIQVVALDRYEERVVKALHELGSVQLDEARTAGAPFGRAEKKRDRLTSYLRRTESLIELLSAFEEEIKKALGKIIFEKPAPFKFDQGLLNEGSAQPYLSSLEHKVRVMRNRLSKTDSLIERMTVELDAITRFEGLDIDLSSLADTTSTFTLAGELPNERFRETMEELSRYPRWILKKQGLDKTLIIILGLKGDKDSIRGALLRGGFERIIVPELRGRPSKLIGDFLERIEKSSKQRDKLSRELQNISKAEMNNLLALREFFQIELERVVTTTGFYRSQRTFSLEGHLPGKLVKRTIESIDSAAEHHALVRIEEADNEEADPPVMFDNPAPVRPFQILTRAYAMPGYNEIDPTFLMALWFPFFFGIMLTDLAYGVILLLFSWAILARFESGGMRDIGKILLVSSLWTILLGLAFGSLFGDLAQRFFQIDFGFFDPLNKADIALAAAILIGVVHLNLGLALGIKSKFGKKDYRGLIFDHLWIILFELAVGLALLRSPLFLWAPPLGAALLILIKKPGGIGPMEINSFFGSNLSYARLLALSLATTGIAMAVNTLGGILLGSIVGSIFGFLILFGGHVFNFAINVFGSFVHSMRLHYVEFFQMFYEGGGREFSPFKAKRRYTKKEV